MPQSGAAIHTRAVRDFDKPRETRKGWKPSDVQSEQEIKADKKERRNLKQRTEPLERMTDHTTCSLDFLLALLKGLSLLLTLQDIK